MSNDMPCLIQLAVARGKVGRINTAAVAHPAGRMFKGFMCCESGGLYKVWLPRVKHPQRKVTLNLPYKS